jgi:succinate-semialdehyde dehydrogenase / glutarate-semialdehyde dehydrogenase
MTLQNKCFINGKWVDAISKKTFPIFNPANMQEIGQLPLMNGNDTKIAIQAAQVALEKWKTTTGKERAKILRKLFDLMLRDKEKLARILTTEQGKSIAEARNEIDYAANFVEWFAEEAKRIYGDIVPSIKNGQRLMTLRQPIGVVAAITPWNFPIAMITRKIAPALAAGCTIVLKPSEETPYSALAISELAVEAGLPDGVLNIVCGDASAIGEALTSSNDIRLLTFTGSTRVGKMLMEKCASTVKKVALELGGNSPFIVFEDANLDKAVAGLVASKLRGGGQSCTSANRIYLHKPIADKFLDKLKAEFSKIKIGNGLNDDTNLGPLINKLATDKIDNLISDAIKQGSKELYSANIEILKKESNCYMSPKIILHTLDNLEIEKTEIFGPIVSAFTFKTEEEVLKRANNTNYGLASYFYTENKDRIWRMSESLEYGLVGVNDIALASEVASFGGIKESGIGREGGRHGILEFLEEKFVVMG